MLPRWIVLLVLAGLPGLLSAATFTVRNTNDSGPDSLRQAIFDANATPGLDSIDFAIGSGPQTISPLSALPAITDPVVLAGDTQPGYAGQPVIELSGAAAGSGVNGLHITSGESAVRSLAINRFQSAFLGGGGNGIVLEGNGGNFIEGCFIGTDLSGMAALGNTAAGVLILNSPDNSVGARVGGLGNVISGNGEGVRISGSDSDRNAIGENRIGTDWNAAVPLGNAADGIVVAAGSGNIIGSPGGGGAISANGRSGVSIAGAASGTVVLGTRIGGALPSLANASHGIEVSADNNTIGGVLPGEGNVILGNGANGVLLISGASGNVVLGNLIGTDRFGFPAVGNAFNGVIASGANNNTIGGTAAGAGNVICANGTNGVRLRSGASGNLVAGNFIGIAPDGSTLGSNLSPLGNREEGVEINDGGAGNTVGPGNVISNNVGHGVLITDATVTGNVVDGNLIGTSPSGAAPAGNGADGVRVANSASGNRIGLSAGNAIAFNTGDGVFIESGTGNAIARNSLFDNGGLGIDLAPDGVNGNDAGDADTGPNGLQNFPVLTSVRSPGGTTVAQGSLGSAPSASYTLEFFSSSACDPSGQGEGQTFLGSASVTTDGSGNTPFTATLSVPAPLGSFVTATAAGAAGNTSEFSGCAPVSADFYTVAPCRVLDTRDPDGPYGGPALSAGNVRSIVLASRCGVPATARAVSVNLTVAAASAGGHLTLYPGGVAAPFVSTLNYRPGQTRANNAIVALSGSGDAVVRCTQPSGSVQVILDVNGYFE